MNRRARFWLAADALFVVGNIIGGIAAAAQGEFRHAGSHLILVAFGAVVAWVITRQSPPIQFTDSANDLTDGLTRLQQSLDAVAIEVERIGEGQRYVAQLFSDRDAIRAPASQPVQSSAAERGT